MSGRGLLLRGFAHLRALGDAAEADIGPPYLVVSAIQLTPEPDHGGTP